MFPCDGEIAVAGVGLLGEQGERFPLGLVLGEGHGQPSVADDLRVLLALTPSFQVMIGHGTSDMVTPFAVSRYVLNHLPPLETEERAQLKLYRGGHMFYLDPESRKSFTADARTMLATP